MLKPKRAKPRAFGADVIAALDKSSFVKVRAGSTHRFVGIWVVVVGQRVFVRSWYLRRNGWFESFLEEPRGAIEIAGREIRVRATHVRSDRVKDAVSRAYAAKYVTPASIKYVKGFARGRRRDATIELRPATR